MSLFFSVYLHISFLLKCNGHSRVEVRTRRVIPLSTGERTSSLSILSWIEVVSRVRGSGEVIWGRGPKSGRCPVWSETPESGYEWGLVQSGTPKSEVLPVCFGSEVRTRSRSDRGF